MDGTVPKKSSLYAVLWRKEGKRMDRRWMALAAALVLTGTLTACGGNDSNAAVQPNNPVTNSGMENEVQGNQAGTDNNGTGMTPSEKNPQDNALSDRAGVDGRRRTSAKSGEGTLKRRTAYDYLQDGKYATDRTGRVKDNGRTDLTQGARDLIREGTDAVRRAGRDVENVTRDMLQ